MYKIAILGCENTHAKAFLKIIRSNEKYKDIEVVGVFSTYPEEAQKLNKEFNVPIMDSFDECVGKVDGVMITARDGRYHYPYAKPYIAAGVPMFLDKPVTATMEDAAALMADLTANKVAVCGGSTLMHAPYLKVLKKVVTDGDLGKCLGGYFRAPINMVNDYGNFSFYAAHNIAMMTEVFGYYPRTVYASKKGNCVDCVVAYEDVNVHLQYVDHNSLYYAMIVMNKNMIGDVVDTGGYAAEFACFYNILTGASTGTPYADLIAPVSIMNAIERSMETGEVVTIEYL